MRFISLLRRSRLLGYLGFLFMKSYINFYPSVFAYCLKNIQIVRNFILARARNFYKEIYLTKLGWNIYYTLVFMQYLRPTFYL